MDSQARRSAMLDCVLERGSTQIEELMKRFGVSRMTVHRDLDELEQHGFLRKVRGGATALPSGLFESNYRYRIGVANAEKRAMAAAALQLIEPGQSLLLDDSTTIAYLADRIAESAPLTVATNAMAVLEKLTNVDAIDMIMLGGRFSRNFRSFLGLSCEQAIARIHANTLFCSASAITGTTLYHQDEQVVKVKRAMMAVADHRVLMIDHEKFGRTALNYLADLSEFDQVISTQALPREACEAIEDTGVQLTLTRTRSRRHA